MKADYPIIRPQNRQDWRNWLAQHHTQKESVWVRLYKKGTGKENLTNAELTEEALCFGWIDSLPRKLDDEQFLMLVSPRKPKSAWSKVNKERIRKLLKANLLTPAGLAKVEEAKRNGSWKALEKSDRLEAPKELMAALKKNKKAESFYMSITPGSKKVILEWIQTAKTDETRDKRIAETVRLAAMGLRANHYVDLKKPKRKT